MLTEDLEYQYHFGIRADKIINRLQNANEKLTDLINQFKPVVTHKMQLIHITTQEEYNVVVKTLGLTKGFKPYRSDALIRGDRYVSVEDGFLAYFLADAITDRFEIIEFDQFIKEAI